MLLSELLTEFNSLGQTTLHVVNMIQSNPAIRDAGANASAALHAGLIEIEKLAQTEVSKTIGQILPAADPRNAGTWAERAWSARDGRDCEVSPALPVIAKAKVFAQELKGVYDWASGIPVGGASQPQGGSFAGVGHVATAIAGATPSGRAVGIALTCVSVAGTAFASWLTHRDQKKRERIVGRDPDDVVPDDAREATQEMLDADLPGSNVTLTHSPTGEWIASVKRGGETLAREESANPATAAAQAAKSAISYDTMRVIDVDDAEIVAPKRKAGGKR